jgi:benzoyl-CoA reductase/2-hydroxyglutaryl-CoA dehydratase subunit BcrC/BadD/HgdB
MSALDELRRSYADRTSAALEWRDRGGSVFGYVGVDVPRELIEAASLFPLRLAPLPGVDTEEADAILGPGVDVATRAIFAGLLANAYPIDYLLLCHDSDHTVRLYTAIRALGRPALPLWFLDLLHLPREGTTAYDRAAIEALARQLASWGGELALPEAIAEQNRSRTLVRRLGEARHAVAVSSVDALTILGAGTAMRASDFNDLLEAALSEIASRPGGAGTRVHVVGSGHENVDVYAAIDELGAAVVSDEHSWGESVYGGSVDERGDPVEALTRHYRTPRTAKSPDADVVLAWIRRGDDSMAWSLPTLRRRLPMPLVAFERRPYALDDAGREALRRELAVR